MSSAQSVCVYISYHVNNWQAPKDHIKSSTIIKAATFCQNKRHTHKTPAWSSNAPTRRHTVLVVAAIVGIGVVVVNVSIFIVAKVSGKEARWKSHVKRKAKPQVPQQNDANSFPDS